MNLHQVKTVCEIAKRGFNMSVAATALHRSQPALSRQIAELEKELGVRIFARTRNKIVGFTPEGEEILAIGERIAHDLSALRQVGSGTSAAHVELRIATTHTHARYSLPPIVKRFVERFPDTPLSLHQGDPAQCCQLVAGGGADIGITTTALDRLPREVVTVPVYRLSRCVLAPASHPVTRGKLTLRKIAQYPLIAYSRPPSGKWLFEEPFSSAGLRPRIVLNAIDADVSKIYVAIGMGIAVLASVAYHPRLDRGLAAVDADHLFPPGVLNLVFRRGAYVGRHVYAFLSLFAPHLAPETIRRCVEGAAPDSAQLIRKAPMMKYSTL